MSLRPARPHHRANGAARLAGIAPGDVAALKERAAVVWFRNLRVRVLPEKAAGK